MYIALLILFSFSAFYYRKKIHQVYGLYSIFRNTVDPEHKKNVCRLCYEVSRIIYMLFCSKPPKLDTFNKKHLKIPYTFRENNYVYLLKAPRCVTPIEHITDENGNSVWDDIYPYLGPNLDCHGVDVFPADFGLTKVIIRDVTDQTYSFEENEAIVIRLNKTSDTDPVPQ